jgi:hypothetical protein
MTGEVRTNAQKEASPALCLLPGLVPSRRMREKNTVVMANEEYSSDGK